MKPHTPLLTTWNQAQEFLGLEIGTRMTAIDLDGKGTLFIHSPIKLTDEIKNQLNRLGTVTYVVAPNKWHHLYLADFKLAYPNAKFFGAPGLNRKRPDFQFDHIVTDEQNMPWNPVLQHHVIAGAKLFNEIAFFHPATKSLLLTDTALHVCETSSFKTKLAFKMMGTFGVFGLSRLEKWLFISDKKAFYDSMAYVGRWDFDRILLCHGQTVEYDGKAKFLKAYT